MSIPMLALPQLCATCDHKHTGGMSTFTDYPACPVCGCTAFRVHPEELAAAEADGALEAAYYPNGRIFDADMARGLSGAVAMLEEQLNGRGWDRPPAIGCFYLTTVRDAGGDRLAVAGSGAYLMGFMSVQLDLRYADLLRQTNANPNVFVPMLAEMASLRPDLFDAYRVRSGDINPADPVAAWWVTWEGWVRGNPDDDLSESAAERPELATDEIRTLICIDVDERVHEINRLRRADKVTVSAEPWPLFAARVLGDAAAGATGTVSATGAMPPVLDGLLTLVRHSRVEAEAHGILRQAAEDQAGEDRAGEDRAGEDRGEGGDEKEQGSA